MAALVAIGSLLLVGCSKDDDNNNDDEEHTSAQSYTFQLNGETYYYAIIDKIGTTIKASYDLNNDYFESNNDWARFSIHAQNLPYRSLWETFDEDGDMLEPDWGYEVFVLLNFKKFDPKSMETGQELEVIQNVQSLRKDSNDPKYLYDFSNYLTFEEQKTDKEKWYTWRGAAVGKIRFVSYKEHPNRLNKVITLEFDNVTFEEYQGIDYSSFPYQAKTITINGEITFSSSGIG